MGDGIMGVKNHLKEIRMNEYTMNQKEFAEYLNIKVTAYCNWENETSRPSLEKAIEIADKLKKDIKQIWYRE